MVTWWPTKHNGQTSALPLLTYRSLSALCTFSECDLGRSLPVDFCKNDVTDYSWYLCGFVKLRGPDVLIPRLTQAARCVNNEVFNPSMEQVTVQPVQWFGFR